MKKFFIAMTAVALLGGPVFAKKGTIRGEGTGVVSYQPDCATIPVSIVTRAQTGQEAQEANARLKAELTQRVTGTLKLSVSDLKSTSFSTRRETRYDSQTQENKFVGYVTSHTLTLEVKDLAQLGRIYDVLQADDVEVSDASLSHSQIASYQKQAVTAAMSSARADAELKASADGRKVGKMLVGDSRPDYSGGAPRYEAARAMAVDANTVINVGAQSVSASVVNIYELK